MKMSSMKCIFYWLFTLITTSQSITENTNWMPVLTVFVYSSFHNYANIQRVNEATTFAFSSVFILLYGLFYMNIPPYLLNSFLVTFTTRWWSVDLKIPPLNCPAVCIYDPQKTHLRYPSHLQPWLHLCPTHSPLSYRVGNTNEIILYFRANLFLGFAKVLQYFAFRKYRHVT